MGAIFDSRAEQSVYRRLQSVWRDRIAVYPQIPVRKVLGYQRLKELAISERAQDYLLKTEFDFTVCDPRSEEPILVVEFDGLGRGFSRDGVYSPTTIPINDPHRRLKRNRPSFVGWLGDAGRDLCRAWHNDDALVTNGRPYSASRRRAASG